MYFLFLFTIVAGASYFIFAPRRFDFLTVFFFSGTMYMCYAIIGHVEVAEYNLSYTYTSRSYAIIVTFFLVLLAGTIARDVTAPAAHAAPPAYVEDPDAADYLAMMAVGGILLGAGCIAIYILADPRLVLTGDKRELLANIGSRPRDYAQMFTIHAVIAAYLSRRHFLLVAAAALALLILFIGSRFTVVMSVLGILVAVSARSSAVRALYRRRIFFVAGAAAAFVIMRIRAYLLAFRNMDPDEHFRIFDQILAEGLLSSLMVGEAMGPALIFLAGLEGGVHLGYGHFFSALPSLLVFMAEAGIDVQTYNDYVQGTVLGIPAEARGFADSNLGSWHAVGGISAVVIFSCAYTGLVILLSSLMHRARRSCSLYLAWLPILTFFNFRNDFAQVFYLSKQVVLTWLLLAAFAAVVVASRSSRRPPDELGSPPAR